jgi:hypothetical protein
MTSNLRARTLAPMVVATLAGGVLFTGAAPAGAITADGTAVTARVLQDSCGSCGRNLIANPGADAGASADGETVPVPHWAQHGKFTAANYSWSGGDFSSTSPRPRNHGKNYFYGGPANTKSSATQLVTVKGSGVRTGKVTYKLSGWLGGYATQADQATLTASFRNKHGKQLAVATLGPVTVKNRHGVSGLFHRAAKGTVPAKTRQVLLTLVMKRAEGNYNDGLADSLSLKFKDPR